jgi:ABC-type transporter MlaC component
MAKFTIAAKATFTVDVGIPVPGVKDPIPVPFTFRHRGKAGIAAFRETVDFAEEGITVAHVQQMVEAWGRYMF